MCAIEILNLAYNFENYFIILTKYFRYCHTFQEQHLTLAEFRKNSVFRGRPRSFGIHSSSNHGYASVRPNLELLGLHPKTAGFFQKKISFFV